MVKSKSAQIRDYLASLTPEERATPAKAKQYVLKKWKVGDPVFYTALKVVRLNKGEPLGPVSMKKIKTKKTKVAKPDASFKSSFMGKPVVNSLFAEFKQVKNLARDFGSLSRVKEVVELMEAAQTEF